MKKDDLKELKESIDKVKGSDFGLLEEYLEETRQWPHMENTMKHTINNPLVLGYDKNSGVYKTSGHITNVRGFVSKEVAENLLNTAKDILQIINEFEQESEDIFNNDDVTKIANFKQAIKNIEDEQ